VALQFAEKLAFVSGYRFRDSASSYESEAPVQGLRAEIGVFQQNGLAAEGMHFKNTENRLRREGGKQL
jgi:hypothetical protein